MSMSQNSSESTSTPTFMETPENSIIDQLSSYAASLAGQMQNWANGVFAQTSAITNQAVGNFFNVSQSMLGLSGNLTGQYNNLFAPENAQLVADANSYASPARMAVDMGQAGATQAQAGDQALKNSEEALRSYGINPSDGRYAALDKAAAVQNAANVAGAENTQRNADIATGHKLRSEAVQVGAQLPAAIANVNNTAIQANTGASNASLANANTGANLMRVPNDFLKTAMDVKLPPTGQNSQSRSSGTSSSPAPPPHSPGSPGGGPGSGGPGGGPGSGGPSWMPNHGNGQPTPIGGGGGSHGGGSPGARTMHDPNGFGGVDQPDAVGYNTDQGGGGQYDPLGAFEGPQTTDAFQDFGSSGDQGAGEFGNSFGQDWGNGNTADPNVFGGPDTQSFTGDTFTGGGQDNGMGSDMGGMGAYNYDPNSNQAQLPDNWSDPAPQMSSDPNIWGNGADQFSTPMDNAPVDMGSDFSGDGGGGYAEGGAIPSGMSPSGGQQIDDVPAQSPQGPARLNANEFVIPQDVALWKGQEFFQNLIAQSRKKRVMAPARPSQQQPVMR